MVSAVEVARLLDGSDVRRFLDDAHQALVARRAAAIGAGIDVGDVVADRAKAELGLDVADSLSQCFGIAGAQDVEGQALSALTSDPGQLIQFINEPGHRLGKAGHRIFELTDLRIDKFASYQLPQFANSSITTCSQSGDAHATQHSAYGGLDGLIDFSGCLVDRGGNQVLQHLDIAGLHHLGVDQIGHRIFELTDLRIDKFASYQLPQFANSSITTCSQSGDAHATQHSAYGGLDGLIDFSGCLVDRGGNQVLQHLDIAGLHHLGVD